MSAASTSHAATFDIAPDSLSAPGARSAAVALLPLRFVYRLPDAFLAQDGDSAWIGGRVLVSGRDYGLERALGTIRLFAAFEPGETLRVRYRVLPIRLPSMVGTRAAWNVPDSAAVGAAREERVAQASSAMPQASAPGSAKPPAASDAASIQFSGNKSVSVEFGTRKDAALRQALDVTTTGRLGGGTEFVAILSDQNASLTDDGGTVQLSDLDRVLIQARGRHGAATLGDFSFTHWGGSFAALTRELTGARLEARGAGFQAQTTVAQEKGEFQSREFHGQEGRQGPYLLSDQSGATGRPVVPGSERVWLDGERLARGEAADYAMDYDRGRLTFTSRRPVSSASRIAIDYEIAGAPYRRNAIAMNGEATRGSWRVFGHTFREADDADHPLTGFLSPADRLTLAAAGNDPERAVAPGGVAGVGDYDLVSDTSGASHYAYAGRDAGGYQVEFLLRGQGQGEYAESTVVNGAPVYRYAGAALGTHVAGKRLALPSENRVLGGGASFRPRPWLSIEGEAAASKTDLNRLSGRDDGASPGSAGRALLHAAPTLFWGGAARGRLEADLGWTRRDERFFAPARQDSAFYQEDWGTDERDPLAGRDERQGSLRYTNGGLSVGGESGVLSADDGYSAHRWRGTAALRAAVEQSLRVDRVESRDRTPDSLSQGPDQGHRDKLLYQATWARTPWLRPTFTFDREERVIPGRSDSSNLSYRAWTAGVSGLRAAWSWNGGYSERREDSQIASVPHLARDLRFAVNASPGRAWSAGVGASRRWTERIDGGHGRVDNGFARLRQQSGAMWSHEAAADWTSEIALLRERSIVFVGPGAGAYDSLGNFVGQGDYDLRDTENAGATEPLARAGLSYRADLRPWAGAGEARGWSSLHVSGLVQSSSGRRGSLRAADFLATPSRTAHDTSYTQGTWLGRVEVEKPRGAVEMYLRGERSSSIDRGFSGTAALIASWLGESRLRWHLDPRWLLEGTAKGASREGFQQAGAYAAQRKLRESSATLEATRFVAGGLRLGLVSTLERASAPGTQPLSALRTGPHVFYALGNRTRLEMLTRWARVRGDAVPVLFPNGFATRPDRFDFRFDASYRVRERANINLTWSGHTPVGARLVQTAVAELRTYF